MANFKNIHEVNSKFVRNDMYIAEINHFVDNIMGSKKNNASDLKDAINALKISCAAHLSNKTSQFISPNKINYGYVN